MAQDDIQIHQAFSPEITRHPQRAMIFVDGENLTLQAEKIAAKMGIKLRECNCYRPKVLIWSLGCRATRLHGVWPGLAVKNLHVIRGYYYTTAVGSTEILDGFRRDLWSMGFAPNVFPKDKRTRKTKGVDISLARDMLSNAFLDNYDVAWLVAGDADYVPLVEEVKHQGKNVYVTFFDGDGSGLHESLRLSSDWFCPIGEEFWTQWRNSADALDQLARMRAPSTDPAQPSATDSDK